MRRMLSCLAVFASLAAPATAQDDVGPPPGRLVDIGGHRLHLHCTGSGSPTVVIEPGASSFSIDFSLVQPDVSKMTRVCSYDRGGSGWSDARPDVETPIRVVRDLRTLLDTAGEKRPFVMVGASRGGVFVRLFQAEYPTDVAGMVLIDPTAEDRLYVMFQGTAAALTSLTPEQHRTTQPPASAVIPIPTRQPQTGAPFDRLRPPLYATRVALDRKLIASMPPTVGGQVVAESATGDYAMLSRLSAARKATPALLGDLPVVVLSRGLDASPEQHAAHAGISKMSRNARHLVVADSYHEIHLSHPDTVVAAIRDVVASVRAKAPRTAERRDIRRTERPLFTLHERQSHAAARPNPRCRPEPYETPITYSELTVFDSREIVYQFSSMVPCLGQVGNPPWAHRWEGPSGTASVFRSTLSAQEFEQLEIFLDRADVRGIQSFMNAGPGVGDFRVAIARPAGTQNIEVVSLSPNHFQLVDDPSLIHLICKAKEMALTASRSGELPEWCRKARPLNPASGRK